jgi:phosphorylcholine metabolism protein LicD
MNKYILQKIKDRRYLKLEDNNVTPKIINTYFNKNLGFGKYKQTAIDLFQITINILNEFNIKYCLISGTLLGYVRHNDLIPWDDDIDLLVESSIISKMPEINKKYNNQLNFLVKDPILIQFCFTNKEIKLEHNKYLLNPKNKYTWPFIDLFIFTEDIDNQSINFFGKSWIKNNFFPVNTDTFLDINVSIPKNPKYFL